MENTGSFWIKSGIVNPSKSEVIGRCGADEKTEWPRRTDKNWMLKKKTIWLYPLGGIIIDAEIQSSVLNKVIAILSKIDWI